MSQGALWAVVLAGGVGCYGLKLLGLSIPPAWVQRPWVTRIVEFVPAALLGALVAVQAATTGNRLVFDGRLVGLAVAALALALRAPFIVVLVLAGSRARSCRCSPAEHGQPTPTGRFADARSANRIWAASTTRQRVSTPQ